MQPQNYERRVFLAVTGLSPQIVTESLYAMSIDCDEEARFIPTEIHLLTTVRGSEHARLNLLSKSPGQFYRFCQDYPGLGLEDIEFSEENIHIISDSQGNFLEDIRNSHENNVAADYITLLIRELTADTELALHVSIAGGRKTMGYYLGYALSLYGREQDRLSHVLVSDPYEKNRDFYYPTPAESVIHVMENGGEVAYDCRNAIIDLAGIPFVRLRQGLPGDLLNGNASFTRVVAEAQKALPDESVLLSLEKHELYLSGEIIKMPPALLAFYAMAAHRRQQAKSGIHWTEEGLADEWTDAFGAAWDNRIQALELAIEHHSPSHSK